MTVSYKQLLDDFKQNEYAQRICKAGLNETMPSNLDSIVLAKTQRWLHEYYFDEGRFYHPDWVVRWAMCLKLVRWYMVHNGVLHTTGWIHHYWVKRS